MIDKPRLGTSPRSKKHVTMITRLKYSARSRQIKLVYLADDSSLGNDIGSITVKQNMNAQLACPVYPAEIR